MCLLIVLPLMVSCGSEEEEDTSVEQSSRDAVTLSMYVITEEGTTSEATDAVESAINTLLKSKYTTKVEITYLTADEYYSEVEKNITNMKANTSTSSSDTETGDETAAETEELIVNEYGVKELKYPDLTPSQIDIVMIDSYEKYVELVNNKMLYNITEKVSSTYKKLGDYIYPSILDAAYINGALYAVPNNKPIGECKYLIVDKAMASEYGVDFSKVSSLSDLLDFFAWVKENKTDVTPIAGSVEMSAEYLNVDVNGRTFTDDFSLVGATSAGSGAESLFANDEYKAELLTLAKCRYEGYFGSENAENFAAAVKEGDAFSMAEYSDNYEIVALSGTTLEKEELCSSMFAVTAPVTSTTLTRAMEVITLLNTSSELRNLLQYGVEGVNYELDTDTGLIKRLTNNYNMDLYKTGNVYMAYPEEGMASDVWTLSKKLNLVSGKSFANPFTSFEIPADTAASEDDGTEEFTVDFESSKALAEASKQLKAALDACTSYEDYEATVNFALENYGSAVDAFLSTSNANTPYALYVASGN